MVSIFSSNHRKGSAIFFFLLHFILEYLIQETKSKLQNQKMAIRVDVLTITNLLSSLQGRLWYNTHSHCCKWHQAKIEDIHMNLSNDNTLPNTSLTLCGRVGEYFIHIPICTIYLTAAKSLKESARVQCPEQSFWGRRFSPSTWVLSKIKV